MTPAITLLGSLVRVVDVDGIAHFVASNVCHALGFRDVPRTLQMHFSEDPHVYVSLWSGSPANHRVLNYDQVLRLINARKNINERPKIKQELMRATEGLRCYQEVTRVPVLRFREERTEVAPIQTQAPAVGEAVMTSIELLEIINQERAKAGESVVRHNVFLARCKDELDGDLYENFVEPPKTTETGRIPAFEAIRMNPDQCKLVAMRESKSVRRHVLARLKEMEAAMHNPQGMPTNPLQDLLAIYKALHGMEGVDPVRLTERTLAAIRQVTGLPTDVVAQALLD